MMRKALIVAAIVAVVAIPMAVGNIGFCRSMPCCPPHVGAHIADAHQPDCCKTSNCAQPPAAARDYTSSKQTAHVPMLLAVAVMPSVQTFTRPPVLALSLETLLERQTVQRRIALLSILLI